MFKKALFASAAVMAAGVASAEITGNFAITSDYIFRGVDSGQAVQGGLDWSNDSGLYAGVWMSNAGLGGSSGKGSADEIDYYFGYGLGLSEGLSLDLGFIRYDSDSNAGDGAGGNTINEIYAGLAGEAWGATLYLGDRDDGAGDADDYMYLDLGYSMSTGETTSVDLHLGILEESADEPAGGYTTAGQVADAMDVSVTYNVGDFGIGISYLDSDNDNVGGDERMNMFVSWGTEFDVK